METVLAVVADRGGRGGMMGGRDGWGDGWAGPLMAVLCVAALVALGLLIWSLVRGRAGAGPAAPPPPPPAPSPLAGAEAILAERLARGEISPDDYRAAAAALRGQPTEPAAPVDAVSTP